MKVRFFSTFEPATSFYRDLLPSLVRAGLDVQVITSRAEYRGGRPPLAEALAGSGVEVTRIASGVAQPTKARQKLQAMATYLVGAVGRTAWGRPADLNVFFSTPPFFAAWGIVLQVLRRQPFLCIIQDVWPDVLVADGRLRPKSVAARGLAWLSRLIWRRADAVVVIGRCMRDLVVAGGVDPLRVHIVPNWAHNAVAVAVDPSDNEVRRELDLGERFVVLYSGNLGVSHSFDEILEVARQFQGPEPEVVFLFIGAGSRRVEVEGEKGRRGLDNVVLLPFQPVDRLEQTLSAGDVHFISLRTGFEGVVVPSKAYGAMAAGRPIVYLGQDSGEIAREIAEHDLGTVVAPGDVEGLADTIRAYLKDPDLVVRQGANGARVSRGVLGPDVALAAWARIVKQTAR